eukprot:1193908-Prorocentrum_minimum.AAC.2
MAVSLPLFEWSSSSKSVCKSVWKLSWGESVSAGGGTRVRKRGSKEGTRGPEEGVKERHKGSRGGGQRGAQGVQSRGSNGGTRVPEEGVTWGQGVHLHSRADVLVLHGC